MDKGEDSELQKEAKQWQNTVNINARRQKLLSKELTNLPRNFTYRVDLIPNEPEIQGQFRDFLVIESWVIGHVIKKVKEG